MEVALDGARYQLERDGRKLRVCGPGCQAAFCCVNLEQIRETLRRPRATSPKTTFAAAARTVLALQKPLLIEGHAGVGKTESAKVLAEVLETDLIRLQCYEGLDAASVVTSGTTPSSCCASG